MRLWRDTYLGVVVLLLVVIVPGPDGGAVALAPSPSPARLDKSQSRLTRSQTTRERSSRIEVGSALGRAAYKLKCAGEVCFVRAPVNTGHAIGSSFHKLGGWLQKQTKAFKDEVKKPSKQHEEWRLKRQSSRRSSRAGSDYFNSVDANTNLRFNVDASPHRQLYLSTSPPKGRPSVDSFPELRAQPPLREELPISSTGPDTGSTTTSVKDAAADTAALHDGRNEEDFFVKPRPVPRLSLPPLPPVSPKVNELIERIDELHSSSPSSARAASRPVIAPKEAPEEVVSLPSTLPAIRTRYSTPLSRPPAVSRTRKNDAALGSQRSLLDLIDDKSGETSELLDAKENRLAYDGEQFRDTTVSSSPSRSKAGKSQRTPRSPLKPPRPPKSHTNPQVANGEVKNDSGRPSVFRHGRFVELPLADRVAIDRSQRYKFGADQKLHPTDAGPPSKAVANGVVHLDEAPTIPSQQITPVTSVDSDVKSSSQQPAPIVETQQVPDDADLLDGFERAASPIPVATVHAPVAETGSPERHTQVGKASVRDRAHHFLRSLLQQETAAARAVTDGKQQSAKKKSEPQMTRAKSLRSGAPRREAGPYNLPGDASPMRDRLWRANGNNMWLLEDQVPFDVWISSPSRPASTKSATSKRTSKKANRKAHSTNGYDGGDNDSEGEKSSSTTTSQRSQRSQADQPTTSRSSRDTASSSKRPPPIDIPAGKLIAFRTDSGHLLYPEAMMTPEEDEHYQHSLDQAPVQSREDWTQRRNAALHHPLSP